MAPQKPSIIKGPAGYASVVFIISIVVASYTAAQDDVVLETFVDWIAFLGFILAVSAVAGIIAYALFRIIAVNKIKRSEQGTIKNSPDTKEQE